MTDIKELTQALLKITYKEAIELFMNDPETGCHCDDWRNWRGYGSRSGSLDKR